MKITLCGSAKFEDKFRKMDRKLTLAGHVVYNLAVYPSEMGDKNWYTDKEKEILDKVHKDKILNSDAIYVIAPGNYIGESTQSEIDFAKENGKKIMSANPLGQGIERTCPFEKCFDPTIIPPCALCYE